MCEKSISFLRIYFRSADVSFLIKAYYEEE